MTANMHVHNLSWEQYDALRLPERTHQGTAWKEMEVGGLSLTFFPPHRTRYEESVSR